MTRDDKKISERVTGAGIGTCHQNVVKLNAEIRSIVMTGEIAGTDHHNPVKLTAACMSKGVTGDSRSHQDHHERREQKPDRPVCRSDQRPVCRPDATDGRGWY